jgi:2-deoxy-D-gluconate 3-dehydrogenase
LGAFDLKGRVAVVTGGNGGIGLGMARGLAEAGAALVVAARNREKSARAVAELKGLGADAEAIAVDVAQEASVEALVKETVARFGRLDILVNNAGINIRKAPHELSLDEWRQVLDTNLTSAFLASHAVHPIMKRQGGGKIINIGSMMSIFGASFAPAYGASKGGIVQFTKACASAWALDNIQVKCRAPGLDRYRADPAGPAASRRPPRQRPAQNPRQALGHGGRHGGSGRLPCEPGLRLRDRVGHSRGRRLFHTGLSDARIEESDASTCSTFPSAMSHPCPHRVRHGETSRARDRTFGARPRPSLRCRHLCFSQ